MFLFSPVLTLLTFKTIKPFYEYKIIFISSAFLSSSIFMVFIMIEGATPYVNLIGILIIRRSKTK